MKKNDLLVTTEIYRGNMIVIQIDKGEVGGGVEGLVDEFRKRMESARGDVDDLIVNE